MVYWTHFKKCLQYNEHNIPVWLYKMLVYLSMNISCFFEAHICSQLVPRSPFFFGTDNVLHLEIVIDCPSMGGRWIDVASISSFVVFPLLQHGVRSEIARIMPFCDFTLTAPNKYIFFLNTQLKLAQKRDPLFWQYTVCKLFKCNNKISLFDLIMRSQSGKGEVGMFVLSIHCMKKSPTSKNMILGK